MEVILTRPVKKLGTIGSIVNVKPGFARNFLIPQKIAIRATAQNKEFIDQQKHVLEEQNKHLLVEAVDLAKIIDGKELTFIQACADDGRLFGSVSKKDVAKAFTLHHQHDIPYTKILLEAPLKTVGVFEVDFVLHTDVVTKIVVTIARSNTEAQNALLAYKTAKSAGENAGENKDSANKNLDEISA